jgi:hypothetical protein
MKPLIVQIRGGAGCQLQREDKVRKARWSKTNHGSYKEFEQRYHQGGTFEKTAHGLSKSRNKKAFSHVDALGLDTTIRQDRPRRL